MRKYNWMHGVAVAAFFIAPIAAQAAQAALALPKGVVAGPSLEGISEYRLPNGLKVLFFPDASKPTVTVNVTYLVGSRHENYGETGMAHLLEHLMFKGSAKHRDITAQFADRGMQYNGTTSNDRTNYYEVFAASKDNLEWALRMEADRMVHSFIARKDLDSEMTVVRNEYESGETSPGEVLVKRMESLAYDWHSYGRSTIGNRSDIENVKIGNLQAFYRTYYQPDNAVLLVAGKFDPAQAMKLIQQGFGQIAKPSRTLPAFWTVEPSQDGERSFTVRRQGDVQIVMLGYKIPASLHDDADALSFASDILGATPSGRLHKLLVEPGRASQVFSFGHTGYAPGLQFIGAVVKKDTPIEPVRDALIEAAEGLATKPPTTEEMERVRRSFTNELDKSLNDPQRVGVALSEAISLGDWRLYFVGRERVASMTSAEVAAAAGRYWRRDNRVVGNFLPEQAPLRAEIPAAPSLATVLKDFKPKTVAMVSEDFDPSQANIMARTKVLNIGGLKVALLSKKNRGETVTMDLGLHWGDPQKMLGKAAIQALTRAMLTRGTSKYTREQLSDTFDKLRVTGGIDHLETTRSNLADVLALVAHVYKEPTFPASELEQLRQQAIVGIEANRNEPQAVASRVLGLRFNPYPAGDLRAATTIDEEIAALKAVTLDEVKAFHRDYYGASHGEIAIVGDFDPAAVAAQLETLFANWRSAASYVPMTAMNKEVAPFSEALVTPDKENAFFTARLNLDLASDDVDYPALMLADHIFGGAGLKSRLMTRIRQKDGLSYGGSSQLGAGDLDRAGSLSISAIAAPQNIKKLDAAIREELARSVKGGFTEQELAGAKTGLLQERLHNRSQDGILAQGWASYLYLNRTFAWSQQLEQKLAATTLAQVNAAWRKAIDPARLSVVTAGK
jgi:zinc protease